MTIDSISRIYPQNGLVDIIEDYRQIKAVFKGENKKVENEKTPWWTGEVIKEAKDNDYLCAKTLAALAILNGPTDLDDIVSAWRQISSGFKEKMPDGYDPKKAQHPFSFFRGTILHEFLNPNSEKCINKNLAKKIIKADVSLRDTKFGAWILKKLGVEEIGRIQTNIKDMIYTEKNHFWVEAKIYKSKTKFGDLTARALSRTPKIAVGVLAGLEGIHAIYNILDGADPKKELAKAAIEVTGTILGMGYLGAIGYKHFATCGSLIGMGLGGLLGEELPKRILNYKNKK